MFQVICCEGNAAFYEAGMIGIPLSGMLGHVIEIYQGGTVYSMPRDTCRAPPDWYVT